MCSLFHLVQNEELACLPVGTEVSAKYKGAFCEAKVKKVMRQVKCRVTFKQVNSPTHCFSLQTVYLNLELGPINNIYFSPDTWHLFGRVA